MLSGPPDSQQGSARSGMPKYGRRSDSYVHLVHWQEVSTGNRGCSNVVDLK